MVGRASTSFTINAILGVEVAAPPSKPVSLPEIQTDGKKCVSTPNKDCSKSNQMRQNEMIETKDVHLEVKDDNIKDNDPLNSTMPINQHEVGYYLNISESSSGDDGEDSSSSSTKKTRKSRRSRTTYSRQQLDALERIFSQEQYPDLVVREDIADKLKLDEERVQIWFQNRRAKFKKTHKEGRMAWMRQHMYGLPTSEYQSMNDVLGESIGNRFITSPPSSHIVPHHAMPYTSVASTLGSMTRMPSPNISMPPLRVPHIHNLNLLRLAADSIRPATSVHHTHR
nr:PREDICTED: paired mesoderm homeobox protein 2-like [Saccoglossus kowalevskii]